MGGCCGGEVDEQKKASREEYDNPAAGERGCTDAWCLIVWAVHMFVFLGVVFAGLADGNPAKLYAPRDFAGNYCGVSTNWNDGPDTSSQEYVIQMMNVTHTTDLIAKQLLCSSAAEQVLINIQTPDEFQAYMCACCKSPCAKCAGTLGVEDIGSAGDIGSSIGTQMGSLTASGSGAGVSLFSPMGGNGALATNIWEEANKYFVKVCSTSCDVVAQTDFSGADVRSYTFSPDPDADWKDSWDLLSSHSSVPATIKDTMANSFTFSALPLASCPYPEKYCVPMPGVTFAELPGSYCQFEMNSAVTSAIGDAAAGAFTDMGGLSDQGVETIGDQIGDVVFTMPALIVTGILGFIVALVFLVLLRWFVGVITWAAVVAIFFILFLAGLLCVVRSGQCAGASLESSTTTVAVGGAQAAAQVTAELATQHTSLNFTNPNCGSEEMDFSGNGAEYVGCQTRTRSGRTCQAWNADAPHNLTASRTRDLFDPAWLAAHPNELDGNFCRNPMNSMTIWCFTTDADTRWEQCSPIGVVQPHCPQGYEVPDENLRKILEIIGYILWFLAFCYVILICCMSSRIKLAIAINKVACMFVTSTPWIVLVPIVQAVIAIVWVLIWAFFAAFLISQVPANYTPTEAYATYAEAYGTEETPGACTDKWPTGAAYKYAGDLTATDDPCSGNLGDTSALTAADGPGIKCWKCSPPRYIFDERFAYIFFTFLWNNAFGIAFGQCVIAGAVAVWFFTKESEGKGSKPCVAMSLWNAFRYHLGSLAFGSFIIAVIEFIRYLVKYFEKQSKAQKNKVMELALKILGYLIWCFEKCMKFLNKNAYIQIAIRGNNFCVSAKNAFFLIVRNAARFGVLGALGAVIQWIGCMCIMCGTTILGYFVLMGMYPDVSPVVPIVLYICMSWLIGKLFMNVFGLAVDTSLQCFIATEELGGDGDGENSFVPGPLKSMVPTNDASPAEARPSGTPTGASMPPPPQFVQ